MTSAASQQTGKTNQLANALADRLEQGANALAAFAGGLTDQEWQTRVPKDGRKVGVVVHHVASVYPIEISWRRSGRRPAVTGDPGQRPR